MLRIGILGAGHLGKIHLQQWLRVPGVHIVGFFDPNDEAAAAAIAQYEAKRFDSVEALIAGCDAVDIVTATLAHHEMAMQCLEAGKHIFVEKPLAHSLDEARAIADLAAAKGLKCQVGHVERYNPAFLALKDAPQPLFIESHRLAQFTPRGADVSVILDLMIHDLDIVLHLVKSPVKSISASGVAVISETPDIANARIEFENGCVANLTSSRISLKKMRKMRLFQRDAYIGVDFLDKKTEVVRLRDGASPAGGLDLPIDMGNGQQKTISVEMPEVLPLNAIHAELSAFAEAVIHDRPVDVSAEDGHRAMEVAQQILTIMETQLRLHNVKPG